MATTCDATNDTDDLTYDEFSEELGECDIPDADTASCSESSFRLVHSRQSLEQLHEQVLESLMQAMFNRNQL